MSIINNVRFLTVLFLTNNCFVRRIYGLSTPFRLSDKVA